MFSRQHVIEFINKQVFEEEDMNSENIFIRFCAYLKHKDGVPISILVNLSSEEERIIWATIFNTISNKTLKDYRLISKILKKYQVMNKIINKNELIKMKLLNLEEESNK